MTGAQRYALTDLCRRYDVPFDEADYHPQFDLPDGYVAGWVGGKLGTYPNGAPRTIYVGCDPDGRISS